MFDNFFSCVLVIWMFLLFLPEACNFIKKETLVQGFSSKFCEISKNTLSYRTSPVAASVCFLFHRALLSNLLPKAFTSLLLVYGKLKNEDFGITLNFLQFNKKFISRSYTLFYKQRLFQLSLSFCLTHYSPVLLFYNPWKHQKT